MFYLLLISMIKCSYSQLDILKFLSFTEKILTLKRLIITAANQLLAIIISH